MTCPISPITVSLSPSTDSLWRECFALEHEMILTVAGRRIFPTLEFMAYGLHPEKSYSVCFHLEQVDDKRLRYTNKVWQEAISTETRDAPRKIWHQQGVQTGKEWMAQVITFDHVRITNKKSKEQGNASYVHLHTQHRYIPVLEIFECSSEATLVSTTRIPHSMFITVTAYHKSEINTLKTNNNPYSTGSRKDRKSRSREISPSVSEGSSSSANSECSLTPPPPKRVKVEAPLSPAPSTPSPPPMAFNWQAMLQLQQAYFMSQYYMQFPLFNPVCSTSPMTTVKEQVEEEEINIVDI